MKYKIWLEMYNIAYNKIQKFSAHSTFWVFYTAIADCLLISRL